MLRTFMGGAGSGWKKGTGAPGLALGLILAWALVLLPARAGAQEFRATVSGTITDPSGASVPNARVTATNLSTGVASSASSNAQGQYVIPFLLPGNYKLETRASGFETFVRPTLTLASGSHPVIDMKLAVGAASEEVTVGANVPLVDSANGSIGQTITTKQVEDLPLNGRTPMMLAQLSIGVLDTAQPTLVHPFDNNGAASWSIGGTPSQTSELLLDGAPDEIWSGSLAYSPPQDAVQEVTVQALNTDAAYGHTIGGTANQILKSGTNQLHGTAYEFTQPSDLDANNWFNDAKGQQAQVTHFNQYGFSLGGPVVIPKVVNGHNKLFWFFAFEGLKDDQPINGVTSVPTDAERKGDFSALLGAGDLIYDPYSGVATTSNGKTTITRQPYPNNVLTEPISPIAQALMKYYPEPNTAGSSKDGSDNYLINITGADTFNNELGRVDWNMSERSKLFMDFRHNYRLQEKNNYFANAATGTTLTRTNWGATFDEVYTLSPAAFFDIRGNWTYMGEVHGNPSDGLDPTSLGFPGYIAGSSQYLQLPAINFSGSCGSQTSFQCLGGTGDSKVPSDTYQLFGDIVQVVGNHTLKYGVDLRRYGMDATTLGATTGSFTFGDNWTNGPTSGAKSASFSGQDFAAFLLGLPTSGQYTINATGRYHSNYYAAYVEDDWRFSPTLTLNLGVRFDHSSPYQEEFGRAVNGFAFNTASPIAAAAQSAYALNPISQIPVGDFNVNGGLTFASPSSPAIWQSSSHDFSPRLGLAWSPASMGGRTVVRAGFAMFVAPVTMSNLASDGVYSSNPITNQEGFTQSTSFVATTNNYLSPANTLSSPFPSGILPPAGASSGLSTFLGQSVSFFSPHMQDPYSLRWNFGVQQQLTPNTMLEADYIGNHAVHLPIAQTNLNFIPRQYLYNSPVFNSQAETAVETALNAAVPNPFLGLLPNGASSLTGKTINVNQLLAQYPEFPVNGVTEENATAGQSWFESLDARVEHRLTSGLSLIGNYTYSKLEEADSYLDPTDTAPEKRISPFDYTSHYVGAFTYALPLGAGQRWSLPAGWINSALGGWTVNGIYTFQTGAPVVWSNDMVYLDGPLNWNPRNVAAVFNTAAFDTNKNDQFQYHVRTFPSTFTLWRQDGINNLDFSVLKNFTMSEGRYLQIRVESFNLLNHPTFQAPNVSPTSSSFGAITKQANLPRQIQLGARLVF